MKKHLYILIVCDNPILKTISITGVKFKDVITGLQ